MWIQKAVCRVLAPCSVLVAHRFVRTCYLHLHVYHLVIFHCSHIPCAILSPLSLSSSLIPFHDCFLFRLLTVHPFPGENNFFKTLNHLFFYLTGLLPQSHWFLYLKQENGVFHSTLCRTDRVTKLPRWPLRSSCHHSTKMEVSGFKFPILGNCILCFDNHLCFQIKV